MSFLEENAGVKMDSGDLETAEPQCGPEGPKVVTQDPEKFTIHDKDHKVLVLNSGTLLAVPHKDYIRPETFFTLPCRFSRSVDEHKGSPIFLAVSKGDLCLCCKRDKKKNQPTLQLKKQNLAQLSSLKEKKMKPFAFYRAKVVSRNTLESAAYPGWFICTSCNLGEPVGMTNNPGQKECIDFSFEPVKNVEMSPSEISK
ncbi:interleukin-37-like [Phyllostomus discolor]|uniref:Interleukin-1 n=1 Tax=Phyllostomus discolor TaxID=89673 RepID=A0A6J2LR25_9CHIR|nr:interleukin-37-like [Phyllostomus discolor]